MHVKNRQSGTGTEKVSSGTGVKAQGKGLEEVKYQIQVPYIILIDYPK